MTTRNVELVDSEYRLITEEEVFLFQNTHHSAVAFAYADDANITIKGHNLDSGQGITRDGLSGNLYGKSYKGSAVVTVSE